MRIDILTVFPVPVTEFLDHGIVRRAAERGLVELCVTDLRDFTEDRHRSTDDVPYGGGGGMVMKVEPIARAMTAVGARNPEPGMQRLLTDPRGLPFDQPMARRLALEQRLVLVCGHYEGVDDRVRRYLVDDSVSVGDYVLTGGELPALIITDAVTRLQPEALGDKDAPDKDSFADGLLEYPHYTRPAEYCGWRAPEMLQCGNHAAIQRWRRWWQLQDTRRLRPDLLEKAILTSEDRELLELPEPEAPGEWRQSASRRHDEENDNAETYHNSGD
ncbi:MAG: tRNA (guanosine(37)-N1)-methyltransferase TrmD [Armatimonadetes bacterium]|nr:tRNA (guanosine(37)-N1)-methyltransferase TrmD [Armatimonadota bacterium]MDE2205328.1 tRNA (guanosine(37)-N1)-methyltransferase TrmD [Armatimonadota bacterium]